MFDRLPDIRAETPPALQDGFELREVQSAMYAGLAKAFRAGKRRPVVMAPTGSGKTKFAGYTIRRALTKNPNQRIAFIVPRTSLLEQTFREFTDFFGFSCGVIRGVDDRLDLAAQVQIATIQTLNNRIDTSEIFSQLHFGLVFVDEAHIEFQAREKISGDIIIGLTATPYSKNMGLYYDSLVKSIPAVELVKQGIITPLRVKSAQAQIDTSKLHTTSTGEYREDEEEKAAQQIIGNVCEEWENNPDMRNRPFLGFAKTIATCVALTEDFQARGHRVAYVHSKMSQEDCEAVLESFKAGLLDGVWSVVKLIEGFDFPDASAILIATSFAPAKGDPYTPNALNRYVQLFGRGRRSADGKTDCVVHDHGQNWEKYGNPDYFEIGFDELLCGKKPEPKEPPAERKQKKVACQNCGEFLEGRHICHICGTEMKAYTKIIDGEAIEYIDGKMVEMTHKESAPAKKREFTMEQKQDLFAGLKWEYQRKRQQQGKPPLKDGFVAHRYRDITGVWPRGIDTGIARPTAIAENWITHERIKYAKTKKRNAA